MAQVLRVSIIGSLPSGETWSVNPVYNIGGDFGTPVSSTQAQKIAADILASAFPGSLAQSWSTGTTQHTFRVEARSLAGVLEAQGEAVRTTPIPGTSAFTHPYQTSSVVSLRTGHAGARGRGRMYWPATGVPLQSPDLRITPAAVTNILTGTKTLLSGISTAIDITLDGISLAVWSRATPATYPVTSLQVGNVADVQRRRRDSLIENYTGVSFP